MSRASGFSLIEVLDSTLRQLEQSSDCCHDTPAVLQLKKEIELTIAELKIRNALLQLEEMADFCQRQREGRGMDEVRAA
jgi:hypothetical protein